MPRALKPRACPSRVTVPGVMKVLVPELARKVTVVPPPVVAPKPVDVAAPIVVDAGPPRWLGPTLLGVGAALVVGCGVLLGFAFDVFARTDAQQGQGALTVTRQAYQSAVWQAVLGGIGSGCGPWLGLCRHRTAAGRPLHKAGKSRWGRSGEPRCVGRWRGGTSGAWREVRRVQRAVRFVTGAWREVRHA